MTVTDILDLKISIAGRSGKEYVNTVTGELIRIEKIKDTNDKNFAMYAFVFLEMDQVQKNFIEQIIEARNGG